MQKRVIPILILLMSISLVGIVFIQYKWIDRAISEKQSLIDNQVHQAVTKVEEQLNDQRAMTLIGGSDFDISELGMAAILGPLTLGIEHQQESKYESIGDSNVKMEIQVMSTSDSLQWYGHDQIIHNKMERHIISDMDSVTIVEVQQGLGQLESVINKIKLEFHTEGNDNRLDSTNVAELMNEELQAKGLGQMSNWGIFDNKEARYIIHPSHGLNTLDYDIPLFTADVIHPGRYNLQLSLDKSNLIWKEIWRMVVLSIIFLLVITIVFAYSIKLVIKHKKISQIKSDFINNMTHEFKTPLASISLAADSILHPNNELTKENVQKYVGIIQTEKDKLNAQVERILEVASLRKDALDIPVETFDLSDIIEKAIKKFQLQQESGAVVIDTKLNNIQVKANAFHLENVLINLIDNGIKYSEGKANISISSDTEGNINVSDKGIGMDKQQLARVFDNFYRAQSGNLHNTKGFGLGLSYSKLVIEKMGGSIDLKSKSGEGTTAIIKLQKA
ncbi:MAG: HAMP domain-containing sensor histidine kinase [Crocinitomicaceae bacterium]|nr:HAMP domain-containing histidine kinase [Crocinitomicaceae bacterium]